MRERIFKRINQLARVWWLFYTFGVNPLIVGVAFAKPPVPLAVLVTATIINYADVFFSHPHFPVEWVIFAAITVGAVLFAVYKRSIWRGVVLFLLPFVLFILYAILAFPLGSPYFDWDFSSSEHLMTERSGEYAFNLLRYEEMWIEGYVPRYNLYQCDSESIRCEMIYHHEVGTMIIELGADAEKPARLDLREGELFLYVAGKLVYQQAVS